MQRMRTRLVAGDARRRHLFSEKIEAMSDYQFCKIEDEGRIRIITIDRPDAMNAFSRQASAVQ